MKSIPLPTLQRLLHAGAPDEPRPELVERLARAARDGAPSTRYAEVTAQPLDLGEDAALRGSASATHRLFSGGGHEVDLLRLEDGAIVAQVLTPERDSPVPPPGSVGVLYSAQGEPTESPVSPNDLRFAQPPPGPYALCIESPNERVWIDEFEFGV